MIVVLIVIIDPLLGWWLDCEVTRSKRGWIFIGLGAIMVHLALFCFRVG
jgi:hypothetical protein